MTEKPRIPEKLLFIFLANSHSTLYLLPLYNNAFINMYKNKYTRLLDSEGEGEGGMIWENGNYNMYTVM